MGSISPFLPFVNDNQLADLCRMTFVVSCVTRWYSCQGERSSQTLVNVNTADTGLCG